MIRESVEYVIRGDASGLLSATGKSSQAMRGLDEDGKRLDDTIHTTTRTMTDRVTQAGAKLQGVGKALTVGLTVPAIAGFTMMAKAAADDAEAQEVLSRNLRQAAGATDEAVAGAEDYITQLAMMSGVADDELRPALGLLASATGDVGEAQDLLAVALDVSVARGKSLDSVTQALVRAYNGSTGGLSRMGIATKDAEGKALSFEQVLANLKTQTEGAAKAAGETGAGSWRRLMVAFDELKESVGTAALPMMKALADGLGAVVNFFGSLGPVGRTAATAIGIFAVALGPVATAVGTIMRNAQGILGWIRNLGGAAAGAGGSVGGLGSAVGGLTTILKGAGIAALIGGIIFAIGQFATATSRFKATWKDAFEHAKEGPSGLEDLLGQLENRLAEIDSMYRGGLTDRWRAGWNYLFGDTRGVREETERARTAMLETWQAVNKVADEAHTSGMNIKVLADALKIDLAGGGFEAQLQLYDAAMAIQEAGGNLDTLTTGTEAAKQSLLDVAAGSHEAAANVGVLGEEADEATDPVDGLKRALDGLFSPMLDYDAAKARFEDLDQRLRDLAANADVTGAKRRREAESIARDIAKSYQDEMAAAMRAGASTDDARRIQERYRNELSLLSQKFPEVQGVASRYIGVLNSTPSSVFTSFGASAPMSFVQRWKALIESVPKSMRTNFEVAYVGANVARAILGVPHRAKGGSFRPGDWSWVGEEGPELVHFGAAGYVHDAEASRQIARSKPGTVIAQPPAAGTAGVAGTTVNVTVPIAGHVLTDLDDVTAAIETGLARAMRRQGSLAFLN